MKNQQTPGQDKTTLSSLFTLLTAGMLLLFTNFVMILFSHEEPEITWADNAGTILWMIGFIFWLIPAITMRKSTRRVRKGQTYMETDKLVVTGIFKFIRHPQYLGFILFNIGFIGITQMLIPTLLAFASVICIIIGIKSEDKELEARFGEQYRVYKKATPAFNIFQGIIKSIGG